MKRKHFEKKSIQQYQASALFFLGCALVFSIITSALALKNPRLEDKVYLSSAMAYKRNLLAEKDDPTEIESVTIGKQILENNQIAEPDRFFQDRDGIVYVSVALKNPAAGRNVWASVYELDSAGRKGALVDHAEIVLESAKQDRVAFHFSRAGSNWQKVSGNLLVKITTSSGDVDKDFVIVR